MEEIEIKIIIVIDEKIKIIWSSEITQNKIINDLNQIKYIFARWLYKVDTISKHFKCISSLYKTIPMLSYKNVNN